MSLAYSLLFAVASLHVGTTLLDFVLVALQLACIFFMLGERIVVLVCLAYFWQGYCSLGLRLALVLFNVG